MDNPTLPALPALAVSLDGFREWLSISDCGATVGFAQDIYACPLASYLTAVAAPGHVVAVDQDSAYVYRPDSVYNYSLPAWAIAFIAFIDAMGGVISREMAQQALSSATQEGESA